MLEPIPARRGFLGIALAERSVAFAFVDGRTAHYRIVHLRHLASPLAKQFRFKEVLERYFHRPTLGVAMTVAMHQRNRPLVTAERAIVEQTAKLVGVPSTLFAARRVRYALSKPERGPATNRSLMEAIAERYGLEQMQPETEPLPNGRARMRTTKERYLQRAALALGAAHILEKTHNAPTV